MIEAIARTAPPTGGPQEPPGPQAGYAASEAAELENRFIQLLVAQIANQDPTKPVESADFLNQFATLSQVKSLENMKALGEKNLVLLDNLQTLSAASLVGQDISVLTDRLQISAATVNAGSRLEHAAGQVTLTLTSASGEAHEVHLGAQPKGPLGFQLDPAELGLPPGEYTAQLSTGSGEKPRLEARGKVLAVRVSGLGPVLDIEGLGAVPFYQISEFGTSPARTPITSLAAHPSQR